MPVVTELDETAMVDAGTETARNTAPIITETALTDVVLEGLQFPEANIKRACFAFLWNHGWKHEHDLGHDEVRCGRFWQSSQQQLQEGCTNYCRDCINQHHLEGRTDEFYLRF